MPDTLRLSIKGALQRARHPFPGQWRRLSGLAANPRAPWVVIGTVCIVGLLQNVYLSAFTGQPGPLWKVWIYELSSGAVLLALIGPVAWSAARFPLLDRTVRSLAAHLLASLVFSVIHVSAMVAIRKGVFALLGHSYRFGPPLNGFAYEFGKDFFTYCFFVGVFTASRWIMGHTPRSMAVEEAGEREGFTVRTTRGNVLVPFAALLHVEASGNYVTLFTAAGDFLHRATMKEVTRLLPATEFARTHRSHLVRLSAIRSIRGRQDGDKSLELQDGRRVPLSRTYASARDWTLVMSGSAGAADATEVS
ncbi:MAG TPA: LytTR family DNA-binding domain-containing protein [Steroidobacteraceae bacterium]|nr:LytTR family DNA-binding domain-containing protein [Steroidobacteraceae bacterium]